MNRTFKLFIILFSLIPFIGFAQENTLTLERIFGSSDFAQKSVPDMQMYPKEGFYTTNELDKVSKTNCIVKHAFKNDKPDTILRCIGSLGLPVGFALEDYRISPTCNMFLLGTNANHIYRHSSESEYYLVDKKNNKTHKIFGGKKVFYPTLSQDEKNVAFVYLNNLYIQDLANDNAKQITKDGEFNHIINGKSDWVYEEEMVVVQAFAWSPKGDKIAFYKFDESKVKEVELPKYDSTYFTQYKYKYPKSGEDNSVVSIWVYHLGNDMQEKLNLHEENDQYIPRIKWTNDDNVLSVQRMNRMQNDLELLLVTWPSGIVAPSMDKKNPNEPRISTLYKEHNNTYIDITDNLFFLKDNTFIMTSEKEGYSQIYHYDRAGKLINKLTPATYDVTSINGIDEKTGILYFTSTNPSPLEKFIYCVKINGGSPSV